MNNSIGPNAIIFQPIAGFDPSASNTDKIAERLPLPVSIAEELAFDLRV
jgi:hypothetical protein